MWNFVSSNECFWLNYCNGNVSQDSNIETWKSSRTVRRPHSPGNKNWRCYSCALELLRLLASSADSFASGILTCRNPETCWSKESLSPGSWNSVFKKLGFTGWQKRFRDKSLFLLLLNDLENKGVVTKTSEEIFWHCSLSLSRKNRRFFVWQKWLPISDFFREGCWIRENTQDLHDHLQVAPLFVVFGSQITRTVYPGEDCGKTGDLHFQL